MERRIGLVGKIKERLNTKKSSEINASNLPINLAAKREEKQRLSNPLEAINNHDLAVRSNSDITWQFALGSARFSEEKINTLQASQKEFYEKYFGSPEPVKLKDQS